MTKEQFAKEIADHAEAKQGAAGGGAESAFDWSVLVPIVKGIIDVIWPFLKPKS